MTIQTIGICGYGKLGRTLHNVFAKSDPRITFFLYDPHVSGRGISLVPDGLADCDLVIPAVPMSLLEETLLALKPFISSSGGILDVSSVKIFSKDILLRLFPDGPALILSHPMFGPASLEAAGGDNKEFRAFLEALRCSDELFEHIRLLFETAGIQVISLSADEHDRLTARSQFLTLLIARLVKKLDIPHSILETWSTKKLLDFSETVSIDDAFIADYLKFNPWCKTEWQRFKNAVDELCKTCEV